ncbi:MAG TPA: HAD family acid phosphatase [Candidatus Binataceae bacterium]|jgi:predicted secreted acid phosphatase|nr:HAD family acid phosphatase [Candidatus Binataceae bacterium]
MRETIRLLIAVSMVLLSTVPAAAQTATAPAAAQSATTATELPSNFNLGQYKIALTRYYESGQYERDVAAAVGKAAAYLTAQANRKGKLAIVLDIDETALSNWPVIKADDFGFIPQGPCDLSPSDYPQGACGWMVWISQARNKPILPTLELYRLARKEGMAVFFITGRPGSLRAPTERNLRAAGYDKWNDLMMKTAGYRTESVIKFKSSSRATIVRQGYTIVLNMGDQESDLAGGYAERTFKVPDPFYYIP